MDVMIIVKNGECSIDGYSWNCIRKYVANGDTYLRAFKKVLYDNNHELYEVHELCIGGDQKEYMEDYSILAKELMKHHDGIKAIYEQLDHSYKMHITNLKCRNVDDVIKEHDHIRYFKAVIDPKGMVLNIIPDYLNTLISLTGFIPSEIYKIMPMDASPLRWLVEYTNSIVCNYDDYMLPTEITLDQKKSLNKLITSGVMSKECKLV